jgi:hypothetical protein
VRRGLRPVQQLERDLRLTSHGSIFLTRWDPQETPGRSTTAK